MKNENTEHDEIYDLYKSTFYSVHASDALKGKVHNMAQNKKKIWYSSVKRVAAIAAIVTLAFVSGNMAVYAATGNNMFKIISIKISGEGIDADEDLGLEKKVDDNGNAFYEGTFKKGDAEYNVQIQEDTESDGEPEFTIEFEGDEDFNGEVTVSGDIDQEQGNQDDK